MSYFGIVKLLPSNSGFGFIFILALALIGPNTKKNECIYTTNDY